ncbi:MAG: ACP S-malonyltransferase [Alphaproteobacteria bacterium]|nr:ACP S-malonyltransferase [Alphaproteobacteria bacterium]
MKRAVVFPGLGSQAIGMGAQLAQSFAEARLVFEEVDEALGQNLTSLMFTGPQKELDLPENAQPALVAVGVAVARTLEGQGDIDLPDMAHYIAGHSLGEYTALCAAGSYALGDMVRFLKQHGQIVRQAFPDPIGGMAVLSGVDWAVAQKICDEAAQGEVCFTANDNAADQVVISGHIGAINRVLETAPAYGCRRSIKLPVYAPYHSPLAQPILDMTGGLLKALPVKKPSLPWLANGIVETVTDAAGIADLLNRQVTGRVRWRESMIYLKDRGVGEIVNCGPGKVLAGLAKKTHEQVRTISLNTPEEIYGFLDSLASGTDSLAAESAPAETLERKQTIYSSQENL